MRGKKTTMGKMSILLQQILQQLGNMLNENEKKGRFK